MANISDASGKISLTLNGSETKDDMMKTWDIIRRVWDTGGDYGATYEQISEDDITRDGDGLHAEMDFFGSGRWTFTGNVESFGEWLDTSPVITEDEKDFLRSKDFSIDYDFADCELGCGAFYEAKMESDHKAGTPLSSIAARTISSKEIEISAANIRKYIGYEDDEIADMGIPREELRQWFLENDSAPKELVNAVFDSDAAYNQLKEDEAGTLFWPYDNNISWEDYVPARKEKAKNVRTAGTSIKDHMPAAPEKNHDMEH